jgi:hypothetical protein
MPRSVTSPWVKQRAIVPGEQADRAAAAQGARWRWGHLAVCGALEDGVLGQRHRPEVGHKQRRAEPRAECIQACGRGGRCSAGTRRRRPCEQSGGHARTHLI